MLATINTCKSFKAIELQNINYVTNYFQKIYPCSQKCEIFPQIHHNIKPTTTHNSMVVHIAIFP